MFKNRIGELAKAKGLKYKYLAKECEVSIQTFSSWVNNKTQPDLEEADIIARELNCTVDELIQKEKEKNPTS